MYLRFAIFDFTLSPYLTSVRVKVHFRNHAEIEKLEHGFFIDTWYDYLLSIVKITRQIHYEKLENIFYYCNFQDQFIRTTNVCQQITPR